MNSFIDTYVVADEEALLASLHSLYLNVIGPSKGVEAISALSLDNGMLIPAQDARGDPEKYYACVRSSGEVVLPEGVSVCDPETAIAVLGEWG